LPHCDLLTVGIVIHQLTDAAEAGYSRESRSTRHAIEAPVRQIHEVGDRLLGRTRLKREDILLAPRFVRAHTTTAGLRRKAGDAIEALWDQRIYYPDSMVGYGNPVLREAFRNLDTGPAADAAAEILIGSSKAEVCPCPAINELTYIGSTQIRTMIEGVFHTHDWVNHDCVMRAALDVRTWKPLMHLADRPTVDFAVLEFAIQYLAAAQRAIVPDSRLASLAKRLLREREEEKSSFHAIDEVAVSSAPLTDAQGGDLSHDPMIPELWWDMLRGEDAGSCSTAATLAKCLGLDVEKGLVHIATEGAVSDRLRLNAVRALAIFSSRTTEPIIRNLARNPANSVALRTQSLWSYSSHGADTSWMFSLLADPSPTVREAVVYAAQGENTGVLLAATADRDRRVSDLALCEVRRLSSAAIDPQRSLQIHALGDALKPFNSDMR
jgi:hypothetical protein